MVPTVRNIRRFEARAIDGSCSPMTPRLGHLCFLPLVLTSLWAVSAVAGEKNNQRISDRAYLHPQRLIAVEGQRRLNLYCTGRGSPAVIFDSGLGEPMMDWALVQPAVARQTRACSYDRAGLGFSDPSPAERTSARMVDDLHRLLKAARIPPPYVLAGHSLGGMNIKLYAETYLPEVRGMVFVDPSHEDLARRSWELNPELAKGNARNIEFLHECLRAQPSEFVAGSKLRTTCGTPPNAERLSPAIFALQFERTTRPGYRQAWISENDNVWTVSAEQLRAAHRSLGDMPIIVLTHEPLPRQGNETQEMRDAQNRVRTELHAEIASMSTRGTVRMVKNSGHFFQLDQPQEVTAAILEVVQAVRSSGPVRNSD